MDRQWFINGVQIFETGEDEYFVAGIQVINDQAAAPAGVAPTAVIDGPLVGPTGGPV